MGQHLNTNCHKWGNKHIGGHGLQRVVDLNGKMLVWCKEIFGELVGTLVRETVKPMSGRAGNDK